jgi:hypothetical protein
MKLDFFAKDLDQLGVRKDFVLDWLSAEEHFGGGGVLLGIKLDVVEVGAFDQGDHFVSALLRNRKDGFKWEVVVVYGLAQHDRSTGFLEELEWKCERTTMTMVIGGDFNLIRCRGIGIMITSIGGW